MGAFFLIGASFALFFAVLISSKDNRTQPDLILTMLFLLLMLHLLGYFTYYEEIYLEYGTYFVLVTAEYESLGSELGATNWSAALLEDLLEEGDVKRYATPTGKLSLTLSYKQ